MELILVRHGLPERVVRDEGQANPDLSATGKQQAEVVGKWLAANESIDTVYASPMKRAHQTGMPYAEFANKPINLVDEVAEFDRDSRSYIPAEQLKKENYAAWQRMTSGDYGKQANMTTFRDTVITGIERIIESNQGKRVLVFCHGGVINIWSTHCLGLEPRLFADVRYCSISRFLCASSGQRNVQSLNETQHLAELKNK